jgi:plasmid stabilization system protein ParE
MANTLSITKSAEYDMMEAFNWYEARSAGLGHDFLRCVEARLNLIARAPQLFRQRGPLHRMARTERFPYAIYFIWEEAEANVAIRRVLHFSQNSERELSSS